MESPESKGGVLGLASFLDSREPVNHLEDASSVECFVHHIGQVSSETTPKCCLCYNITRGFRITKLYNQIGYEYSRKITFEYRNEC